MTTDKGVYREKQLRERVQAARATMKALEDDGRSGNGEWVWASMYAQDVEPLRRHLTAISIRNVAVAIGGDPRIVREAIQKAHRFLSGRSR